MLKDLLVSDYPRVFTQTAVVLNKVPYFIYEFLGTMAECFNIKTQKIEYIDFSTKPTISLPKTGYVNIRGIAIYMYRGAFRQYKHGLCYDNVCFNKEQFNTRKEQTVAKSVYNDIDFLQRSYCYDMFVRKYPSFEMATKMIQQNPHVELVAFDPQFAISNNGSLFYRGRKKAVGYFDGEKIIFLPDQQELEKALPVRREKK